MPEKTLEEKRIELLEYALADARSSLERLREEHRALLDGVLPAPFAYIIWDSRADAPASPPYYTSDKAHQFAEMWNMGAGHERFTVKEVR